MAFTGRPPLSRLRRRFAPGLTLGGVHAPISGTHWFMACWYLEPKPED